MLAWNEALVVGPSFAVPRRKAIFAPELKAEDYAWRAPLPKTHQVEAVALAGNAILYAGRVLQTGDKETQGFLVACSPADGKLLAEVALGAPPTYAGVAVACSRVYVSLYSGELLCFGT